MKSKCSSYTRANRQNGRLTKQNGKCTNAKNIWPGCRLCSCDNFQSTADLIIPNYWSNQSALMTRCRTDMRHQYGIFCGESHTSFLRNATRAGSEEGQLFLKATWVVVFPASLCKRKEKDTKELCILFIPVQPCLNLQSAYMQSCMP